MKRLAAVVVTPELIGQLARRGCHQYAVDSDIPSDAEFHSASYDACRQSFVCIFEHDSFRPVVEGAVIPILRTPTIASLFFESEE